ncbi:hypothetical protein [Nocardioides sp.]|uniref:hypothetical protein n=1 Tax=Nocardioides sp. TaxID=35761 RepID=UPI002D80058F|nr:hypothetical protein [Nocardioides sp.]HET8960631.1 hypothetical protein [Nocardioides sp.]
MSRRVSLPAADDLFRRTAQGDKSHVRAVGPDEDAGAQETQSAGDRSNPRKPSGRVRHDEKMTVYVTSDELLDLEHARLSLRRAQGLAVDRGRLVREAVALVLADYEANGDESVLVRRLTEE